LFSLFSPFHTSLQWTERLGTSGAFHVEDLSARRREFVSFAMLLDLDGQARPAHGDSCFARRAPGERICPRQASSVALTDGATLADFRPTCGLSGVPPSHRPAILRIFRKPSSFARRTHFFGQGPRYPTEPQTIATVPSRTRRGPAPKSVASVASRARLFLITIKLMFFVKQRLAQRGQVWLAVPHEVSPPQGPISRSHAFGSRFTWVVRVL